MREPSEGGIVLTSPNHLPHLTASFLLSALLSLFVAKPFLLPLLLFPVSFKKETRRTHGLVLPAPSHYTLLLLYISRLSLHLFWCSCARGGKSFRCFSFFPSGFPLWEILSRDPLRRPLGGLP